MLDFKYLQVAYPIHPIDSNVRLELLEIIEDRHGKKSTLISTQLPVAKWYELFEDTTVADALMDTIRIDLKSVSILVKPVPPNASQNKTHSSLRR